jgi:hypothetical protein
MGIRRRKGMCKIEKCCWYRMRHSWLDACTALLNSVNCVLYLVRGQDCAVPAQNHTVYP